MTTSRVLSPRSPSPISWAFLVFLTLVSAPMRGVSAPAPPRFLPSSRPPKLLRGPYLQLATPNSIVIRWRTEEPSSSVVRYGPAPGTGLVSEVAAGVTKEHIVLIPGLTPNTRYFY